MESQARSHLPFHPRGIECSPGTFVTLDDLRTLAPYAADANVLTNVAHSSDQVSNEDDFHTTDPYLKVLDTPFDTCKLQAL